MYDHERFSNRAITVMPVATQPMPASAPAVTPHESVVFGSVRNIARLADITKARRNAPPKARPLLKVLTCSSVKPFTRIQILPNNSGEYHSPPTTKVDNAA